MSEAENSVQPAPAVGFFPPEYYADSVQIGTNPWGFILQFGLQTEGGPRPVSTVRMSPQHTKVMALILKRLIREWEANFGEMQFPDELVRELNLPDEL
jgi:hypothetical protein